MKPTDLQERGQICLIPGKIPEQRGVWTVDVETVSQSFCSILLPGMVQGSRNGVPGCVREVTLHSLPATLSRSQYPPLSDPGRWGP